MNHTTNYNLSQYEATDRVTRTAFNSDNAAIDAALKTVANAAAAAQSTAAAAQSTAATAQSTAATAQSTAATAPKIAFGSYSGTGTYGSWQSLNIGFAAKLVIVNQNKPAGTQDQTFLMMLRPNTNPSSPYAGSGDTIVSWDSTSVRWYNGESAYYQRNQSGRTYYWVAIG